MATTLAALRAELASFWLALSGLEEERGLGQLILPAEHDDGISCVDDVVSTRVERLGSVFRLNGDDGCTCLRSQSAFGQALAVDGTAWLYAEC